MSKSRGETDANFWIDTTIAYLAVHTNVRISKTKNRFIELLSPEYAQ